MAGDTEVKYKFCDIKKSLCDAWRGAFQDELGDRVEVHCGDIFLECPPADAIVSPVNSFGFMDGGIDRVFSEHFGWQLSERLRDLIRKEHNGELLVGEAVIIPTYEDESEEKNRSDSSGGQSIKYLISAPTMRAPEEVDKTANAYLAFRAIILAVKKHNANLRDGQEPIRSVLCPGLGTAVGKMPSDRCAFQMLEAFRVFEKGENQDLLYPERLLKVRTHHKKMCTYER